MFLFNWFGRGKRVDRYLPFKGEVFDCISIECSPKYGYVFELSNAKRKLLISISSPFTVSCDGQINYFDEYNQFTEGSDILLCLIGNPINEIVFNSEKELVVKFHSGHVLIAQLPGLDSREDELIVRWNDGEERWF